jgi:hypothetical protein
LGVTEERKVRSKILKTVWICVAAAAVMMRGAPVVHAGDADSKTTHDEQEKRGNDLEKSVPALGNSSTQMVARADIPWKSLDLPRRTEIHDLTDKIELALCQDYLEDREDTRVSVEATNAEFCSLTETLNSKAMNGLQFGPGVHWDHSDKHLYNEVRDRSAVAVGLVYLY